MCLTSCEGTLDDIFGEWSRPTGNNGNTKTTVAVKSVTLDQTTLTKAVGDDAVTLTATVDPTDASDKTVTWKSSDASIAAVDANGKVTFVAAGTATITATAPNGTDDTADDKTAECAVTVNAAAAKVTTAPTATTGTIVAGSTTALVTADVADGGTMMYNVTTTNSKPSTTDGFSATVPTAEGRAAGTYYVWYYAKADDTHTDSEIEGPVTVTISSKSAAIISTAPTATTGITEGQTTALVSAGTASGGTMMYLVTTTNSKPSTTDGFSATVPTAEGRAAGTYYVWYYAKADDTHTDSEIEGPVTVTISSKSTTTITSMGDPANL